MDMKAISWVGNIYQKFETMCLEMEEAMYKDTVKYVENQVQTVGASVKMFYSEVVKDTQLQYNIDPVKVAAADLSLNPYAHNEIDKNQNANLKGSTRGFSNKLNDDSQVIKCTDADNVATISSVSSDRSANNVYSEVSGKSKSGRVYKRQNLGIKRVARDIHPAKMSDTICLASGNANNFSSNSEVRGGFEMASDQTTLTMTSPLASIKGAGYKEAERKVSNRIIETNVPAAATTCSDMEFACKKGSEINSNTQNNEFATEEINESSEERLDDFYSAMSKKCDIIESETEIAEKFDEPQLEETCVLVEGDMVHVPQPPAKRKSYKKKLREVFSTKMRSTRKEYEQLEALYGGQQFNPEAADKVMPVLVMNSNTKSTKDHSESEWELL